MADVFLAIRELRFARARFALMGAVVALIAVLMVLLSGLSQGLVRDGVSGLQQLPVTSLAFSQGVQHDAAFTRSVIDIEAVDTWKRQPGVTDAAPFGTALVNARSGSGVEIDLALFGVDPGSFLAPDVAHGTSLGTADGIVVSSTAVDAGLKLGDTLTIDRLGTRLTVVGVLPDQHTFGHVDVAYLPLAAWQGIHAGIGPGEPVTERAKEEITAVAVRGQAVNLTAGDAAAGTESLTLADSYGASPGYTAETSTLTLIQVFLYLICALVVGAFFTVWTIQRKHELAVLRALGAGTGYLLRDGLAQALVLLLAAAAVGIGAGVALGASIGDGVPFSLDTQAIVLAAALLVGLGLVGATAAIARIAAVDPATALGGNR